MRSIQSRQFISRPVSTLSAAVATALLSISPVFAADKTNYQDHVLPIFRNSCLNCHNPDKKKAGLDLSTYSSALAGSSNGPVVNAGDPDGSMLYKVVTHAEEPTMPPKKDKLPDKELDVIKAWIAAGALETATGKPVASTKPKINMTVAVSSMKRPDGPPLMPKDLLPEPVVRADRPWAAGCMASSPWSPIVAVGGQHQILLYNTNTLELLGIIPFTDGEPQVVQFSRSGGVLLVGGGVAAKSGKVALWDLATGTKITDVGDEFDSVLAADLSPDQAYVALGGPTKVFKIYSTRDGTLLHATKKHTDWVTAVAYSPDGVLLASADRAGGLWVWEAKNGNEFYNLAGHKAGVTCVAFRDDSNFLASASEDGTVKLWDMQSGNNAKSWPAHSTGVLSIAFTHDGRLVTCGRDKVVKIWSADGNLIRQFDPFTDIALHAAFDSDGKRVIAGDWTGEIRVWDCADGKQVGSLSSNPLPLADRLAEAEKRLGAAQPGLDKANADVVAAQAGVDQATKDQQAAQNAADAAKKAIDTATAQAKSADDSVQSAKAAAKTMQDRLSEKQLPVAVANKNYDSAMSAYKAAQKELSALEESVNSAQSKSDAATQAAATAATESEKKPDDAALAKAAREKREAADQATQKLDEKKNAVFAKLDQEKSLSAAASKAGEEVSKANADLASAKKAIADQLALADKLRAARTEARAAIPKTQAEYVLAEKAIAPKVEAVKTANARLVTAKAGADSVSQQLSAARMEVSRLKVAQFYLGVYSARQELVARQLERDQAVAAVAAAQAEIDGDNASIAAAQKQIAGAAGRLKELEAASAKAKADLAPVAALSQTADAAVAQRQALLGPAQDLDQKLWAESHKSPDDKAMADASAKAKSTVEPLAASLEAAKLDASRKADALKAATAAVASADAALAAFKAEVASAPKKINDWQQAAATVQAAIPQKKSLADAASKAVVAAQTKVDQLTAEYQKKSQEAGLNQSTASASKN